MEEKRSLWYSVGKAWKSITPSPSKQEGHQLSLLTGRCYHQELPLNITIKTDQNCNLAHLGT